MGKLAAYALAALPMTASAQSLEVIRACADVPIGATGCVADDLAHELGLLAAEDVSAFSDVGMESFAMLTALRLGASAIFFAAEGEGCVAEEERTSAVEIWSTWVSLPERGLAPDLAERFAAFDGVMSGLTELELAC